jgi:Flp pilus assembly pilin Flp
MAVEYGLLPVLVIISSLILIIFKNLGNRNQLELSILFAFLTQNLTNDLVYSPDVAIYFWIIPTYLMSKVFKD